MQDDSFLPMKGESKTPKKRRSNFNMQNQFKGIPILQPPLRLNQSISKLRRKSNNERNIIKDYLHLHKFGLQRKKTRKITVKALKSNADKSFMFNNSSHNEAVSMVYYPEDKKKNNKKINTKLIELKKETTKKTNLKHIENSLFLKLHNMKSSFQQIEGMNNIDNINDDDNFLKIKTCKTNNISNNCIPSHRSSKNNLPINNSYYVNKFNVNKGGIVEIECEVDVRQTWSAYVLANNYLVARQEHIHNKVMRDDRLAVPMVKCIDSIAFATPVDPKRGRMQAVQLC